MAYTFLDQQNFLSSLLGDSNVDASSQWPTAQRQTELNHAEKQFARDTKILMETATGTASSKVITIPTGWIETFVMHVTVSSTLYKVTGDREISIKDLERWNTYSGDFPYYWFWASSGTRQYTLVGSSNLSSAAYSLYYFEQPTTALSGDTDESLIPEEYRQAPVFKTASNLLLQTGQYSRSGALLQAYDRLMVQARDEARKWYLDYEAPRPDMNIADITPQDMQGQGY